MPRGIVTDKRPVKQRLLDTIAELQARIKVEEYKDRTRDRVRAVLKGSDLTRRDVYDLAREIPVFAEIETPQSKSKPRAVANPFVKKGKQPPRYRHPTDAAITWTGFSRKPDWVLDHLKKKGATLDDLLIPGARPIRPGHKKTSR